MSIVSNKRIICLLMDEQNRTYFVQGGVVQKSSSPVVPKKNPNGWKDMSLQFATNQSYFATLRSFTSALQFVKDYQLILADRLLNGKGVEEVMYLAILKNDPTQGLNYYALEYKERIDFSKFTGDPHTGISENTLPYDVFALVQAQENTMYSIPCNSSNPLAFLVLFDGILLQDKLNYSVINVPIINNTGHIWWAIPLSFLNNEGDSVGVTFGSQNYDNFDNPVTYAQLPDQANNFLVFEEPTVVQMTGSFSFKWSALHYTAGALTALFFTSLDTAPDPNKVVFSNNGLGSPSFPLVENQIYTVGINMKISLQANEKLFFMANIADAEINSLTITPFGTTISAQFSTEQYATANYVMRPIDVLQSLVQQITLGRYTADSNFLRQNNRKCVTSGSALRTFPDAQIQTCFADFFQSYSSAYNMGIAVRNGVLWMEPLADLYSNGDVILSIVNASNPVLTVASEFIYAGCKVGYLKQIYNQRNGRYEFNCTHNYTFPITTVLNQLNLVSTYRADAFGMEFIRQNYVDLTSTDDKGDTDVFVVMVADQIGQAQGLIDNTIPANILTLILAAPVIQTPYSNTVVYSQYPTVGGVAQPNVLIGVYADGFLDGTVRTDANGNWTYQIQTALRPLSLIFNGQHTITANAQDNSGDTSDFSVAVLLTVNPALVAGFVITFPTPGDAMYDNLPMISGCAPQGSVIRILLDGVQIGIVVANSSSLWSFQTTAVIANGNHTLTATSAGLPPAPAISITTNSAVTTALITNILYNGTFFNNTPTLIGVGIPGTTVLIYIDGGGGPIDTDTGIAAAVGSTVVGANGRWQYQITSMTDPASDLVIDYVPDGLHTFGTTALPTNVEAAVSGNRLMRGANKGPVMDYSSVWLDDSYIPPGQDPSTLPPSIGKFLNPQTLYNVEETSPYIILRQHDNILNSFLAQQAPGSILFNGAEVNADFSRNSGGVVISESANVPISSLAQQLYWPYYLSFKAIIPNTFNQIMTQLETGGIISVEINGLVIDCLPIGTMSVQPATDAAQSWKLLVAGSTPLSTLVQLFKKGTTFTVGKNMVHFSNLNSLHFVKYNFTPAAGYHFMDIYDNWQKNRQNNYKGYRKDFMQPWQTNDFTTVQAITSGVGILAIDVVNIKTGLVVDTLEFAPAPGSPIQLPDQLQQVDIDFGDYPPGQYWFVPKADGVYFAISEPCNLAVDWPNTLKFETAGSSDQLDFWFSGGIAPMIRVPATIYPWTPDSDVDLYEDEAGDWTTTRSIPQRARIVQFGNEDHLIPDWMSIKMNEITGLDNLLIEGSQYTRNTDSKWDPQDLGQGIPDVMIKIAMVLAENPIGNTFQTAGDNTPLTTPFVLDGTAFGLQPGVNIVTSVIE